jgi:hypothetical protein
MNCSGRTPSLEMVRKCFMVSPHERHTMVGPLSGTKGQRSMVEGVSCGMCVPTETGGSATDSQPPMPGTGPLSVMMDM